VFPGAYFAVTDKSFVRAGDVIELVQIDERRVTVRD
jgi:hypothetical protein